MLRHRPAMLVVFVAVLVATVRMFEIVPKGFIPGPGQRFAQRATCRPRRGRRSTTWSRTWQRIADGHQREPLRRHVLCQHRRRLRIDEHGAIQRPADAAAQPAAHRGADRAAAPAAAASLSGLPRVRRACRRRSRSAGAGQQLLQPDGSERRHRGSLRLGGQARGGHRAAARGAGRLGRHADEEPAGQPGHRSRRGRGARPERQRHRDRALRRLRPAVGVDDLRVPGAIQGAARARPASIRSTPTRSRRSRSRRRRARSCRWSRW